MLNEFREFDAAVARIQRAANALPTRAATEAVNFSKERFRQQNWVDTNTEPWKKRKPKKKMNRTDKRAILVKSGRLMRSIRKITANYDRAVIGTDVEYAQAHNDGERIRATASVSSHNRKGHSRKRKGRKEIVKAHEVKAHTREVNIRLPRRQFIGNSAVLDQRIQRLITADINRALKG